MNEQLAGLRPSTATSSDSRGSWSSQRERWHSSSASRRRTSGRRSRSCSSSPSRACCSTASAPGDSGSAARTTTPADARAVPAWRAAALVLGLILIPLTLAQLVDTLGGNPDKSGHTFWTFAVTAAAGWYAAFARGLRWGALFGGLAVIVSWIALCDALVRPVGDRAPLALHRSSASPSAAAAVQARPRGRARGRRARDRRRRGRTHRGHHRPRHRSSGRSSRAPSPRPSASEPDLSGAQQRQEWDVFLLVLALLLIWYGLRAAWRGPVYIGAITLFAFILSVGHGDHVAVRRGTERRSGRLAAAAARARRRRAAGRALRRRRHGHTGAGRGRCTDGHAGPPPSEPPPGSPSARRTSPRAGLRPRRPRRSHRAPRPRTRRRRGRSPGRARRA